jgi:prevent-host-death family protein
VSEARNVLPTLVDAAEGGRVTPLRKDKALAVLAPVSWLGEGHERLLPAMGSLGLTEARPQLGKLILQAADGPPVVLTRGGQPVAVLIADIGAPPARTAAPVTVPAGLSRPVVLARDVPRPDRPAGSTFTFGLEDLDAFTGGISEGLVVVAGDVSSGAQFLPMAAARRFALSGRPVFYAASGTTKDKDEIFQAMAAAQTGVMLPLLRSGELRGDEARAAAAAEAEVRGTGMYFDIGDGLSAETIAEVAPCLENLALVVVDRLQRQQTEGVALSGDALPEAARVLARLAAVHHVPILAVLDCADPEIIASLDADMTLTVSRRGQDARVMVAERALGETAEVRLTADLSRARFTAALPTPITAPQRLPAQTATPPVPRESADSAEPAAEAAGHDLADSVGTTPRPPDPAEDSTPAPRSPQPGRPQRRPGQWPAGLAPQTPAPASPTAAGGTGAGTSAAPDGAVREVDGADDAEGAAGEPSLPLSYGPFAVLDGNGTAVLADGTMLPCRATSVRELAEWAVEQPLGMARLRPYGRDADPLVVLMPAAAERLGLPASIDGGRRALEDGHEVLADLAEHGWKVPVRGGRPWFSAWPRIHRPIEEGTGPGKKKRRSVMLAVTSWGALTTGGWPLPVDADGHLAYTAGQVREFLAAYCSRVRTPVSSTASTGTQLMDDVRPPTRAWRDPGTGKIGPAWVKGAVHVAVDPAPPEVPKEHPLARGRDHDDPAQVLREEALNWWRQPTGDERALPFVVAVDVNCAFAAAANRLLVGTAGCYHLPQTPFDKKLPGSWLYDLSGVDVDPLMPSPFTPDGIRPAGSAWYETHTIARAVERGFAPGSAEAYVRPTAAQAAALGLRAEPLPAPEGKPPAPPFGNSGYLTLWYEHLTRGYLETMAALGVTSDMPPGKYLQAMDLLTGTSEQAAAFQEKNTVELRVLKAVKATFKGPIGKFRYGPKDTGRRSGDPHARWAALDQPLWRPDMRAAVIARSRANLDRKIDATAAATGARPLAVLTDAVVYASAVPDIRWLTGHKGGFRLGPNPGFVKQEGVQDIDWYLQLAAQGINPARKIKGDGIDAALEQG